ncbi:MAG: MFS transporter [Burkholderiales bacterium PBB1]|nr:MAG: MFS transporter [Burkholderiales bacterium PBB1]
MVFSRALLALILGQVFLHACMTGVRVAAPLLMLRQGHAEWAVGLLLGLFAAAPVATALRSGRMADRHGYHRPMRLAVALAVLGALLAAAAVWLTPSAPSSGWPALDALRHAPRGASFAMLAMAAMLCGVGANMGLITIQRSAGRLASGGTEVTRVFSWLGLAPAVSNMIGPVVAGAVIDAAGFGSAFLVLAGLPLISLAWMRQVPVDVPAARAVGAPATSVWTLLRLPGLRRLLLVNWLLSSSWDLHAFLVPVLGHERGLSASAIGLILGTFAAAVASVRLVIPWIAHHLREAQVLTGAMLTTAAVFAIYPFAQSALAMAVCGASLGMALGCVQPMIMTALHRLTPQPRHGEALALRSMTINGASTLMPLLFGLLGSALGAAPLFWLMGAAMATGSLAAWQVGRRSDDAHLEAVRT